MDEGAEHSWNRWRGSTATELEFTRRSAMRDAAMTDRQKTDEALYGSYAPRVRGREVTAQSKNKSRTRRKGGAAMNSKIAFRSAMLALVAVVLGVAGPADAKWVNITGTHTAGEIKGKCSVAGGDFSCPSNNCNNGFRCDNTKNGGGKVTCGKDGKCIGSVPARTQPQSGLGIGDVLGGAPLMRQGEPPAGSGGVKPPIAPGKLPVAPGLKQP
jgi:hypothetical protein